MIGIFSEKDLGKLIRRTLSAGVFLSLFFFFLGFAFRYSDSAAAAVFALRAGVIVLMVTPAARVIMLVYGYWRTREYHFALASFIVLALLFVSVLL
ncbi:MAG: DUF1634 domain-containing protein [Elusimicrobiota bacterium]